MGLALRRAAGLIGLFFAASCSPQPIVKTRSQILGECTTEAIKAAPGADWALSGPAAHYLQACMDARNLTVADLYPPGAKAALPAPAGCDTQRAMPEQAACYVPADRPYDGYTYAAGNASR